MNEKEDFDLRNGEKLTLSSHFPDKNRKTRNVFFEDFPFLRHLRHGLFEPEIVFCELSVLIGHLRPAVLSERKSSGWSLTIWSAFGSNADTCSALRARFRYCKGLKRNDLSIQKLFSVSVLRYLQVADSQEHLLAICRALRSAKVAFFHSFAERNATIKDRTMLTGFFSRNKSRMLYQMLSTEAFVGPCAQRTQQVWRPKLGRQTCCESPGQARHFAMACAHENHLCTVNFA